jgi:hypothetical protein
MLEVTDQVTADGCSAIARQSSEIVLVGAEGIQSIDADGDPTAISPDGTSLVVTDGGRLLLTDLGEPTVEPIDLGPANRRIAFTER